MTTDEYRVALDAAIREYEALGARRRAIDERLAQLAQTIGTLNRLCGFVSTVQWGLTDACRVVLKGARRPMTPVDVRDRLDAIGFDLSKYSNSLAAIHTILKRLHESGEVLFVERPGGKFACEWRQTLAPARPSAPRPAGEAISRKRSGAPRRPGTGRRS